MTAIAYERLVDALRDHGSHVVENGHGTAKAQCPSHADTNPSLSLKAIDGRVLIYCHAGCQTADIVAALSMGMVDLFDNRSGRDYAYPGGLIVSRYYPRGSNKKTFAQKGNKGDTSLYGSEHIQPDTKVILVVEGEQDVDAARSLGLVAVTAKSGAGRAAKADWSPCHGHPVMIIADKDDTGRRHAADVAGLLDGHVPQLGIFEAADGCKDLTDHVAAGHGIDELVAVQLLSKMLVTRLADVQPITVSWLWPGYLPVGKLVMLDGDPDVGKSTLGIAFASTVSTGGQWPDSTTCTPKGDVLILSAEDGLADTIRPRLDAAGGDAARVHAIEGTRLEDGTLRPPTLADVTELEWEIRARRARLLIIDVLMAFVPTGSDSNKDQDIRRVLARLAALADRTSCTVLLLRHLNKGTGRDPLYRGGGSIGIVGAARAGLLAARDPDNPDQRVLASIKSNLAPTPQSLTYRLVESGPYNVARVAWGEPSTHTARDLLDNPEETTARTEAEHWLEDYLMDEGGIAKSKDAKRDGKKAGIAERTLRRAANTLKVQVESCGFPRETLWSLPKRGANPENGSYIRGPTGPTGPTGDKQQEREEQSGPTGPVGPVGPTYEEGPTGGFKPPTGPGRCPYCGWHIELMGGHHDDCPANPDNAALF